jgi:hypothetical protein
MWIFYLQCKCFRSDEKSLSTVNWSERKNPPAKGWRIKVESSSRINQNYSLISLLKATVSRDLLALVFFYQTTSSVPDRNAWKGYTFLFLNIRNRLPGVLTIVEWRLFCAFSIRTHLLDVLIQNLVIKTAGWWIHPSVDQDWFRRTC